MIASALSQRRQRGGALLTVLWLSAGLAAIALSVSTTVRSETDRVSTSADGLRASYLASGAVERAVQWMLWGPGYFLPDSTPRFWGPNSRELNMNFPSGVARVEVIPESAKLNINLANADDLSRVVLAVSGDPVRSQQIAEAIVHWRTNGDATSPLDQYYFSLGPTFRARHSSFQEIEELLLVRGMSPELFYGNYTADDGGRLYARGGLRDCLSVWGSLGPFDINSASPALLQAMGLSTDLVTQVVARRNARRFAVVNELAEMGVPAARVTIRPGIAIYTLRATARLRRPDGSFSDVVRSAAATVKMFPRQANPQVLVVLRWYEDAWSQDAVAPAEATLVRGGNVRGAIQ